MKHIKRFYESSPKFNDSDYSNTLENYINRFIEGSYTINDDGTYDVEGNVRIYRINDNFSELPLKFNNVTGHFNCNSNALISLNGCPKNVGGNFNCSNNVLTSLEGCPSVVGGFFSCYNNYITSLKGCPIKINDAFVCGDNKLTSLEWSPLDVFGTYQCCDNKLTSLKGPLNIHGDLDCHKNNLCDFYDIGYVNGGIRCEDNQVYEIFELCPTTKFIGYLNEFRPIRGNNILIKRLQECLYMCDKEVDISELDFFNYFTLE